jgi:Na+-transporting methylmalonyl-CoA/oxaloacetate decarboxylase gamma subunit
VLPFAVAGAERWIGAFLRLQWLTVTVGAFFLILGWTIPALLLLLIACLIYANGRSLERFVEAQERPPFRIKEFR